MKSSLYVYESSSNPKVRFGLHFGKKLVYNHKPPTFENALRLTSRSWGRQKPHRLKTTALSTANTSEIDIQMSSSEVAGITLAQSTCKTSKKHISQTKHVNKSMRDKADNYPRDKVPGVTIKRLSEANVIIPETKPSGWLTTN